MSDLNSNTLTIVIKGDAAQFTRTVTMVEAGIKRANVATREFGHTSVTSVQAASGAIRLLEGDITRNVRAVERFITMLPGVGTALKAAFPVVGALALGGVIYRLGEEVYKFIDGVVKVPKAIQDGFRDLNLSGQLANDQLAVTNARLSEEIAKLEHKPQNGLSSALAEARVRADELAKSLMTDVKMVNELLEKQHIGLAGEFLGQGGTGDNERFVKSITDKYTEFADRLTEATFRGDDQAIAKTRSDLEAFLRQSVAQAQGRLRGLSDTVPMLDQFGRPIPGQTTTVDNSANRNILTGLIRNLEIKSISLQELTANESLQQQKQSLTDRQEQARQTAEAERKQQEQIIRSWQSQLDELNAAEDVDIEREVSFWAERVATAKAGSQSYIEALDNANKAIAKIRAENVRSNSEFEKTASGSVGMERFNLEKTDQSYLQGQGKAAADFIKTLNDGVAIQQQNATALAEASLQMAVATGQMSRFDAAQVQAQLHTQEYEQILGQLQDVLRAISSDPTLSLIERTQRIADINNQIAQLQGQRQIQAMQDYAAMYPGNSLASVGIKDALDDFVSATRDAAGQMRQITQGTLYRVNEQIVNAMSGRRTDFAAVGESLFRQVAGSYLEKAEGSVLSFFGLGPKAKPDGTQANPLWVRSVDMPAAADSISKLLSGGDKGLSGLLGTALSFSLPGFAAGGPIPSNLPAIVGEEGPELFVPRTAGTIVPNHALSLGGGHTFHFNIDARGASDPSGVRTQVMAGIREMTPHIISASVAAQQNLKRRYPTTRK